AAVQSFSVAVFLQGLDTPVGNVVLNPGIGFQLQTVITMVTGTIFIMWLGEQITEHGIGNGISLIIMVNILSRAPTV
ncbi:unnamed protein product, partial [marine sediment metagenome]